MPVAAPRLVGGRRRDRRGRIGPDAGVVVVEHERPRVVGVAHAAHAHVARAQMTAGIVTDRPRRGVRDGLTRPGSRLAVGGDDHPLLAQGMPPLFPGLRSAVRRHAQKATSAWSLMTFWSGVMPAYGPAWSTSLPATSGATQGHCPASSHAVAVFVSRVLHVDALAGEEVRGDYHARGDAEEDVSRVVQVIVDGVVAEHEGEPRQRLERHVRTVLELFDAGLRCIRTGCHDVRAGRQIEAGVRQQPEDAQRHLGHASRRPALDTGERVLIEKAEIEHRSAAGGVVGVIGPGHVVCGDAHSAQRMHDLGAGAVERPAISDADKGRGYPQMTQVGCTKVCLRADDR